jgi:hypothetical protein
MSQGQGDQSGRGPGVSKILNSAFADQTLRQSAVVFMPQDNAAFRISATGFCVQFSMIGSSCS